MLKRIPAMVILLVLFSAMGALALTPDGSALLEFKNSLSRRSSTFDNWRASDALPCSWSGIHCTPSGDVQNITLSSQLPMLEGTVSPSLGRLKSLQGLVLHGNLLSGSIPPELGSLKSLRTLSLFNNSLSGDIPPELGRCESLVELWLDGNRLSGTLPESLGNLKNLNSIFLGTRVPSKYHNESHFSEATIPSIINDITGSIPSTIYKNLNLKSFDISTNNLDGNITTVLEKLSEQPSIEWICLDYNNFSGIMPPSIGNATTLVWLYLRGQDIGAFRGQIPKELGKLTSLKELDLSVNTLNGTIPSSLGNLVNLEWLALDSNYFSGSIPTSFSSLTKLRTLMFSHNAFTGPFPTYISKMFSLEHLGFWNNSCWGPIPKDLGRFMPNLTILSLNYNFFNGTLPDGLCGGGKLQRLGVGGNKLEGPIPSSLANCTSLVLVDFGNNSFTSIPDYFGRNSSLELLSVSGNNLTGQLPKALGANSKLSHLDLSDNMYTSDLSNLEFSQLAQNLLILNVANNNFTGEIPAAMAICNLLFSVDLSYNSFTGTIPLAFAKLSKLQILQLQGNNLTKLDPNIYSSWATTLRTLNLADNPLNAQIAIEIGSLEKLETLNLSHSGLTGFIPSQLGKLKNLHVLDLSHNKLIGEVPNELGELMSSLVSINISFNRLTGSLPPAWVEYFYAHPESFRGNSGLCLEYTNDTFECINKASKTKGKLSRGLVVAMAVGGALVLIVIVVVMFWWHGLPISSTELAPKLDDIIVKNLTNVPLPFTFDEIMTATENFSDAYIIGQGSHGVVYKVVSISSGVAIAVKKIKSVDMMTTLVDKSFWNEIETVGNAKHRNLVKMLGFMTWGKVGLLLYDYVSNGDLHSTLHNRKLNSDNVILTWKARLCIAEGVAHGLAYLHHDCDPPIVHRDIKSSNVLLDNELKAHISDFGLAKLLLANTQSRFQQWFSTPNVSGTYGYVAPEVGYGTIVSPKLDVYSYGVLLLELLTGKQPVNASFGETWHIVAWINASMLPNKGRMNDIILDPLLLDSTSLVSKDEMFLVLRIALLCTRTNPSDRPTMRDVAQLLKNLSQRMDKSGNMEVGESSSQKNGIGILSNQI